MVLTGVEFHRHGDALRHPAGDRGSVLPAHHGATAASQRLSAERRRHQARNVEAHRAQLHAEHRRHGRPVKRTHAH